MSYNKKLPGESPYDKAFTDREQPPMNQMQEPEEPTFSKSQSSEKTPNTNHRQFAVASTILGISSLVVILIIPIFGLALATVGGIFSIVFGAMSRKEYNGLAWTGIIISIIALALVLIGLIILCIVGWSLVMAFFSSASQGMQPWPNNFYRGFGDGVYLR